MVHLEIFQSLGRSRTAVETELHVTVQEFKVVLAALLHIPRHHGICLMINGKTLSNHRTLASYGMVAGQIIVLTHRALPPPSPPPPPPPLPLPLPPPPPTLPSPRPSPPLSSPQPPPPSTSICSMSGNRTLLHPSIPCRQDLYTFITTQIKKPKIFQSPINSPDFSSDIIEGLSDLRDLELKPMMLRDSRILHYALLCFSSVRVQEQLSSDKSVTTDKDRAQIKQSCTVKSMYCVHCSSPPGPEKNQLFLGLTGLNLVGTSGSGPNTDSLPNPWAANTSERGIRGNEFSWENAYNNSARILRRLLKANTTLEEHCNKQYIAIKEARQSFKLRRNNDYKLLRYLLLVSELDEYFRPIWNSLLPDDMDYGSFADLFEAALQLEDDFSTQLAELERMGYRDRRANVRALIISEGDMTKACVWLIAKDFERLMRKKNANEGKK